MNFVGAGFGNDVQGIETGAAKFGGKASRHHLELLNGFLGEILRNAADLGIVVFDPVHGRVRATAKIAKGGNLDGARFGRVKSGSGGVARQQECQFQKVASVERQLGDRALIDLAFNRRARGLHAGDFFAYNDCLRRAGDVEAEIRSGSSANFELEVLHDRPRESFGSHGYVVPPGRQIRDGVDSVRIGLRTAFYSGRGILRRDGCSSNGPFLLINHRAI